MRSRDTGALFALDACCWPEFVLELFDVGPLAPADGGPLPPPPFDGPMGLGEGVDAVEDAMFISAYMREEEERI